MLDRKLETFIILSKAKPIQIDTAIPSSPVQLLAKSHGKYYIPSTIYIIALFPINLSLLPRRSLSLSPRQEFLRVHLEEIRRFLRMITRDVVEGSGGDVVGLAFADERVVFKQVLDFRLVAVGLRVEDFLGLFSKRSDDFPF